MKTVTAENYHGKMDTFGVGQTVTHYTDDGMVCKGRITDIEKGMLHIAFEDGDEGWEQPSTCLAENSAMAADEVA